MASSRASGTTSRRLLGGLLVVVVATVSGCSNDDGASVAPDGGTDAGTDAKMAPCTEPVASRPAGSACVRTVSGRLVEDAPPGAPLALLTTVCGAGLCLLAKGDASGFEVAVNRFVDLDASFVVHVDGRPSHANVFLRLARASAEAVTLQNPIRVPKLDTVGPALPASGSASGVAVTAGDVTLTLAAGTTVELDFADAALEAEGRLLRVGRVSNELAADPAIVTLHAMAPFGAALKPSAGVAVRLPADAGVADGTAVDLVALDDTLDGPEIGRLVVVGTATVTGGVAKSDPGSGLSRLTWIGIRRKTK